LLGYFFDIGKQTNQEDKMKFKFITVLSLAFVMLLSACGKSDADIQKAAQAALTAANAPGATVTVKDGVATLTGEVADITVKNKAESAVKVDGVKSVTNNLTLKPVAPAATPPPDQMLKGTTEESLKKAGCPVTIDVKDGTITATGTVPNAKYVECVRVINESGLKDWENKIVKGN
jgi:hyperosmotically inducible protein